MAKSTSEITKKPLPSGQMDALSAVCDTFLPSIDAVPGGESIQSRDDIRQFYRTSASAAGTPHHVAEFLQKLKHPKMYLARLSVAALSTRVGTFLLCGTKSLSPAFPYLQRFATVSPEKREEILLSWTTSYFYLLGILFGALKIFTALAFFTQVNEKGENVSWKAIGYCGPDPAHKARKPDQEEHGGPLHKGIIDFHDDGSLPKLEILGFPVSTSLSEKARIGSFRKPSFVISCDAVVVGSGSGGGVVAGVLAKAGHRVIVLEKGGYTARSDLSLLEGETMDRMYLNHGILGTSNMDVMVLAGSTVGGGSTINWSACIRTPPHVAKEWCENHGLELFGTEEYEQALDVVCRKMGVQSEFETEGFNNLVLRKGCESLGYAVENIPRNAPADHYCGWCCLGCTDGSKKGTSETWLLDLVESGNGAILTECEALEVITENGKARRKAVGVAFSFQTDRGREIGIVEAKATVVACGAICTPGLLKRSGLNNPNIGKNLHLHPVVMGWGYFPEGSWPGDEKRSYEGGIMTAMSNVTAGFEGSGYGAIIQTPALHPGMFSVVTPWVSGRDFKDRMVRFSRTAHVFALARDRGSGEVFSDSDVKYSVADVDQWSLREGMEKVLRILAGAGAEEIGSQHKDGKVFRVKGGSEEEFERFVREESSRAFANLSAPISSAHQMGSCRMGVESDESAVDMKGETWEVEGLFVADSSVLPTALGVNPMVTIQAIAYCTAQSVLQVLVGEVEK